MKRVKLSRRIFFGVAAFLAAVYAFPFFLVLLNSFKEKRAIRNNPIAPPEEWLFSNYIVIAIIVTSSMLAYYLARTKNKFTSVTFLVLVASMIVPFQALMIPFVGLFGNLGLTNSRASLVFFYVGFGVALSTFLYHGFISNIPLELDEAAAMDGASDFMIFRKIIFPMLSPVTATVAIINGLWIWNDFLLPQLVLTQEKRTLPLRTYVFYGTYTSDYGLAMAGLVLSILPIVAFYFVMQRQIISGVSAGAVK
jgi:raffinose/stachyose/melibiose transport system permease protein